MWVGFLGVGWGLRVSELRVHGLGFLSCWGSDWALELRGL